MTKKEIAETLKAKLEVDILTLEIKEQYFTRKILKGEKKLELLLGQLQAQIRENKEFIAFLKEIK